MTHTLRLAFALVVLILAGASSGGAPIPKDAGRPGLEYYPLAVGTAWVYTTNGVVLTVRVTGIERLGKEDCVRVETEVENNVKMTELYAVRANGVYRVKVKDDVLENPVKVLSLPLKLDSSWEIDSKFGEYKIKGTMTIKGLREKVKTPAGSFEAVLIESSDTEVGGKKVRFRFWYSQGHGMVKQEITIGEGDPITIELSKFIPGEAAAAPKP